MAYAYFNPFNDMGFGLERSWIMEIWKKQSDCMVYLYPYIQYYWYPSNNIYLVLPEEKEMILYPSKNFDILKAPKIIV